MVKDNKNKRNNNSSNSLVTDKNDYLQNSLILCFTDRTFSSNHFDKNVDFFFDPVRPKSNIFGANLKPIMKFQLKSELFF